jgi:hypothetical protein
LIAVMLASQQPDRERLERLKTIAPGLLGRAYLINENTLQLIAMARQGASVQLAGEDSTLIVTAANVDAVTTEYEGRRVTYAAAIRARRFASVAGEYELSQARCPAASVTGGGAALVTLTQREFVVSFDGVEAGVVVERTLVTGQGDGSDGTHSSGSIGGNKIELRPFGETGGNGCSAVLTRYRRPDVRLERPERLIGSWEGSWDGEFGVRFTITPSAGGYRVRYEWQEYQGGAFDTLTVQFHPASKHSIRGGSLQIFAEVDGEYGARAVGYFARTRMTKLKRVTGP